MDKLYILILLCLINVLSVKTAVLKVSPGNAVQEHRQLTFTCQETELKDNMAMSWYRDGTALLPIFFNATSCSVDMSDPGTVNISQRYQFTCRTPYTSSLTIPAENFNEHEHNSSWYCYVTNFSVSSQSESIRIYVLVPVQQVYMTTPDNTNEVYVSPGVPSTLRCTTGVGRPQARIEWYMNGINVTGSDGISSNYGGYDISAGRVITTSSYILNSGIRNETISCKAKNIDEMDFVQSSDVKAVFVVSPSENPIITSSLDVTSLFMGDILSLVCSQTGGNPPPRLIWGGACTGHTSLEIYTDSVVRSEVTITVAKDMDKEQCICYFSHPLYSMGSQRNSSINLNVRYPPSFPSITTDPLFPWRENSLGRLLCNATNGNPADTNYTWAHNDKTIITSTNVLTLNVTKENNAEKITCHLHNLYTQKKRGSVSKSIILDVEYTPVQNVDDTTIAVIEGENVMSKCKASGNPVPTVMWLFGTEKASDSSLKNAILNITNISRTQNGSYYCTSYSDSIGKNGRFSSLVEVSVNVLFPPEVKVTFGKEKDKATITCTTFSNPANSTIIAWTQVINGVSIKRKFGLNSIITFIPTSYQDIGIYTCKAANGIPNREGTTIISGSIEIPFTFSAEFCQSQEEVFKYYIPLKKEYTIRLQFLSYFNLSNADISWLNDTYEMSSTDNVTLKFSSSVVTCIFHDTEVNIPGFIASMHIKEMKPYFYGNYTLLVEKGNGKKLFSLLPSAINSLLAKPDQYPGPTFSTGIATGAGACFVLYTFICILLNLIRRRMLFCKDTKIKFAAPVVDGTYEEMKEPAKEKHLYMELDTLQQHTETAYDNTNIQ